MSLSAPDWKCRLFASVDIAGSTAFKAQQSDKERIHWVSRFKNFFAEFPQQLRDLGIGLRSDDDFGFDVATAEEWQVWKFVGDEILFYADVNRHEEVCLHLHTLKRAVDEYERVLQRGAPLLGLKTAAWLANFPLPNAELEIQTTDVSVRDFLGPGIDLGFRVAKFADRRRIPVSAGLAALIASAGGQQKLTRELKLGYDGRATLKGVMKNRPYPIFWIDRLNGHETNEDRLCGLKRPVSTDDASKFLDEFFQEERDRVLPFIPNDQSEAWNRVPGHLNMAWNAINADNTVDRYRESVEAGSDVGDGGDTPAVSIIEKDVDRASEVG